MVKVKDISVAKENLRKSATRIPEAYKTGIANADWKTNAASTASEDLYNARMQEALQAKRRQKGIEKVSNDEWKKRATEKGVAAIGQGVALSVDKWARNYQPYADALEGVQLPAKTADPIANIQNRAIPVVQALVDKKKEIKG